MTYTDADLERAMDFITSMTGEEYRLQYAQLIADIRNETIERCAGICDAYRRRMEQIAYGREKPLVAESKGDAGRSLADAIRALKGGGK